MKKFQKRFGSAALAAAVALTSFSGLSPIMLSAQAAAASAVSAKEFQSPSKSYQPGVRWWWPGGAVEKEELIEEIDYLAKQNIGFVEINPFGKNEVAEEDAEKASSIYTPEFYQLLDVAITEAEKKGITVDLNMGSGWNANSPYVDLEDTMGNMALGRKTVTGSELSGGAAYSTQETKVAAEEVLDAEEIKEQDETDEILSMEKESELTITAEESASDTEMETGIRNQTKASNLSNIEIPTAEKSNFYYGDRQKGDWDLSMIKLQGVLVSELTGDTGTEFVPGSSFMGPTPAFNEFQDADGQTKIYPCQVEISNENSIFVDADDARIQNGVLTLSSSDLQVDADKSYEVIALYYLPSGGKGVDCQNNWYVVDHLNGEKTAQYINEWLGDAAISNILNNHKNIRAVFNDSYEFYSDVYYEESMIDLAKDSQNNGLGYDFSKYLPTIYREYSAAPFYMGLGTKDTFLTYSLEAAEKSRITYDYNTLVASKFAEGLEGFQSAANAKGLLYRQEAYNPPIDTLNSAQYVDIPEAEQGNELSLIRVSSGAHLYQKNLVTCEQYTLGCTPFKNTLEQVKIGYDNMATSGVNNFFYHGMSYLYGVGTDTYGENGWSPMSGTGINVSEKNTLSPYLQEMNLYAARVNYMMQQGTPSKDVAYYMPFNGSLSETDAVKTMNYNGVAWDAINDTSIQASNTTVSDGVISVNGGNMQYQAILVDASSVPVQTMEKLKTLAEAGAVILFYGNAAKTQPGYADGNYAEEDQKVQTIASAMYDLPSVYHPKSMNSLANALSITVDPRVSYARNENVRFTRRTLSDGGELVYIRNISNTENTITVNADSKYQNFYWMDQNNGKIYPAEVKNGKVTFTLGASTDTYSGKYSMAIALLCEPAGTQLDAASLSKGTPAPITKVQTSESKELVMESLTVTADNLDGTIGGAETTVVYKDQILGKWNEDSFHGGALKTVAADGTYQTSYTLEKGMTAKQAVLKLNKVYTAATVYVNGKQAGKLMYQPYELDLTSYLKEGKNDIKIVVTPRKMNRYYNTTNGQYSSNALIDTGMEGPAVLSITKEKTAQPAPVPPVVKKNIAGAKAASVSNRAYTGKLIKPAVKVTYQGTKLTSGKDYTVSYKSNKNPGKAKITLTGKGNYTGTKTITFKIVPKKQSLTKLTAYKTKAMKAVWKKDSRADGYQIQYSLKSSFKSGVKTVTVKNNKTTSKIISKLKKNKTYYARVRSYKVIDGKKQYGTYSGTRKVRVK